MSQFFGVRINGQPLISLNTPAYFADGTAAAPSLAFASATTTGLIKSTASYGPAIDLVVGGTIYARFGDPGGAITTTAMTMRSTQALAWVSGNIVQGTNTSPDLYLYRIAAGQLGLQKDSTHGVTLDVATDSALKVYARDGSTPADVYVGNVIPNAGSSYSLGQAANAFTAAWINTSLNLGSASKVNFYSNNVGVGSTDSYLQRVAAGQLGYYRDSTHGFVIDATTDATLKLFARDGSSAATLQVGTVLHSGVAFASLPSATAGMVAYVTDSNTATWGATIAGGGANKVLAFYNGTNWTVAGK